MRNLWYNLYVDTLEQVTRNMNIVDVAAERVSEIQVIGYGKICTAPNSNTTYSILKCSRISKGDIEISEALSTDSQSYYHV
jgi:hypothetical protein